MKFQIFIVKILIKIENAFIRKKTRSDNFIDYGHGFQKVYLKIKETNFPLSKYKKI